MGERCDSRDGLREEVDALAPQAAANPDRYLPELVRLHRVLTVRSAVYREFRTHLFPERVRHLFDGSVDVARRLSEHNPAEGTSALVTAFVDRSTFHTAVEEFGPPLDDYREALRLMREAD